MPRAIRLSWGVVQILFLVFAALYFGRNQLSLVRFDRERIEISAFCGQTQVTGLYHYSNRAVLPVSFSLGLPFPVDSDHDLPAAFSVTEVDNGGNFLKNVTTRIYRGGTVFRLWFPPTQEKWIRVDYIQGTRVNGARYILLTTRKWGRSLDRGEYILHLGPGLELTSSSYAVQRDILGRRNRYSFDRSDFLPSADWEFTWHKTPAISASAGGKP
jgi:hypothetical protein